MEETAADDIPVSNNAYEYTVEYAQDTFDRFYKDEAYEEAVDAGKLVIQLLLQEENHDKLQWGSALTQLASAQRHAGELDPAIQNYEAAIGVIESEADRLNLKLVDPLVGMARAQKQSNQLDKANDTYERALHVQKVNSGLHSMDHAHILMEMSEVYFAMGDYRLADDLQEAYVSISDRNYPGDDVRRLPAMYSRANLLERIGDNRRAQVIYRRIVGIVERAEDTRSLSLLPALLKIAEVFIHNDILDGYNGREQARRYIMRAIAIAESQEGATNKQKADVHIAMGDFLRLKTADLRSAVQEYQEAWSYLSEDEAWLAERNRRFSKPVVLNTSPSSWTPALRDLQVNAADEGPKNGLIVVNYDVDRKGRARNLRVVESVPEGYADYIVLNHIDDFVLRPRFEDGQPVDSSDIRFEVRYSYDEEEAKAESKSVVADNTAEH